MACQVLTFPSDFAESTPWFRELDALSLFVSSPRSLGSESFTVNG